MEGLTLIKRGAESLIYHGRFLGIEAIYKVRVSKSYRHPLLDRRINMERTISEAKIMLSALTSGVNVPALLYVDVDKFTIIMEFLEGKTIKDAVNVNGLEIFKEIGTMTGKMHLNEIIHGDLTTNNMIFHDDQVFFIDFGLSKRSRELEDKATEVHVFLRSLESVHPDIKDQAFSLFLEGYDEVTGMGKEIMEKVEEIRMRGRYVDERRNKVSNRE
ncbi:MULTISPECIES: Kae1-associated kinase Bud32 [Metallosphaera]|uniref:non-specific serine/threonine protein kinase n=3 Tax=Metallosphaera TaxID=41980 RepID=A4YIW1_METS5|nr:MULTISPECIES: Kae1-associated kinase Bud32 [Metallosphaera]ABP96363.1 Mn2+-dependent serine/threonine protein kinase [Metallosphaera sedula DSM 5348]AIM28346.1 Mn2+-dependent serine/threonine protein kinase [Metallosphaera sedula]AKV75142.1 serine/threonine protein kinase [Metallosphaera sedula]AKV77380.1 serine/threonine protein kinase [Metallosphaera sedula]AKV79631.1 serine/threonine protein kinase [Metallosphaera sedula]